MYKGKFFNREKRISFTFAPFFCCFVQYLRKKNLLLEDKMLVECFVGKTELFAIKPFAKPIKQALVKARACCFARNLQNAGKYEQ